MSFTALLHSLYRNIMSLRTFAPVRPVKNPRVLQLQWSLCRERLRIQISCLSKLLRSHGFVWWHPGRSGEVRPQPEADLWPAVYGVHAVGRCLRGHRLPGLHPGSLVPWHRSRGEEAGMWLEPCREPQPDSTSGQQLRGPEARQLWEVPGGLELYRTHLWPAGTGPEEDPHGQLHRGLGVRLWWKKVICYGGELKPRA